MEFELLADLEECKAALGKKLVYQLEVEAEVAEAEAVVARAEARMSAKLVCVFCS